MAWRWRNGAYVWVEKEPAPNAPVEPEPTTGPPMIELDPWLHSFFQGPAEGPFRNRPKPSRRPRYRGPKRRG